MDAMVTFTQERVDLTRPAASLLWLHMDVSIYGKKALTVFYGVTYKCYLEIWAF